MKNLKGTSDDGTEDELQRFPAFMRASAYFERREQQVLQAQQMIGRLQGAIHNVMINIARLLAATPTAGNQAILDQSFAKLQGLANAVTQTSAAESHGGDVGVNRPAEVDLTGIKAAIENHANSPSVNGPSRAAEAGVLEKSDEKTRNKAAREKELPSLDAPPASERNQKVAGDDKPIADAPRDAKLPSTATPHDPKPAVTDAPLSNLERVKLALAKERGQSGRTLSARSDLPLPDKCSSRSNAAALKLDHVAAVTKAGAASSGKVDQAAKASTAPPKVNPTVVAAVSRLPVPAGV